MPGGHRRYLFEVIQEAPRAVLGEEHFRRCGTDLGILVKYLDAERDFLLQCHPSRDIAKRYWNSDCGKTECWHVLATRGDAPAPPSILLGFRPGVTRKAFEAAYRAGDMERLEAMCHRFPIRAGDTYFIPAGMPHALGEGCFVIELQEPTDLTAVPMKQERLLAYRSESNPLGVFSPIEESRYERRMLESFVYKGDVLQAVLSATQTGRVTLRNGDWGEESLLVGDAQTPYFALTMIRVRGSVQLTPTGMVRIGIVTEGSGELLSPSGSLTVRRGSEVFFPCYAEEVILHGSITLVLCHPEGAILR